MRFGGGLALSYCIGSFTFVIKVKFCIALAHSACIQIYICGGYWNQNPSIFSQGKLAKFAAYWFSQRPEFLKVSVNDYAFCCRWKRSAVTAATPCPPGWRIWACMSTCKTSCPAATALWTASETFGSWRLSMWVTVMYKDSEEYQRVKLVFRCLGKKIRIGKRVWQFTSGSPPNWSRRLKLKVNVYLCWILGNGFQSLTQKI